GLLPPPLPTRLAPSTPPPAPTSRRPWPGRGGACPGRGSGLAHPTSPPQDGDVQRHAYLQDVITQVSQVPERPRVAAFGCHVAGCQQEFGSLEAYEHHYRSLHTHVCSVCRRSFPSAHLLDVHILEWHDSLFQLLAERQSMHRCLVEGCPDRFRGSRERKEHLVRAHRYPPDFRFDQPRKAAGAPGAAAVEAMEVCPGEAPPPPPTASSVCIYPRQ
uniref:C2H2-type domain-containing protein n=1 Tax=Vombatus ursinus TaxID=29139 RepID=A0A4X2KWQ1_VOMUR